MSFEVLTVMKITEQQLMADLEILRHGGAEAVVLFMDVARRCFEQGGGASLHHWVAIAGPALPEADRNATITLLLRSLFGDYDLAEAMQEEVEHHTLQ